MSPAKGWVEVNDNEPYKSQWQEIAAPEQEPQKNFMDVVKERISGLKNVPEELKRESGIFGPAVKQGFQEAVGSLPYIGKNFPAPNRPPTGSEPDEELRSLGRFTGKLPVMGGIAAPIAAGGSVLGLPAIAAASLGAGAAGGLTTPGDTFHRLVGAGKSASAVSSIMAGLKLPQVVKILRSKFDPKEIWSSIQKGHDEMDAESKGLFENVKKEGVSREIPANSNPKLQEMIEHAEDYLPEGKAMRQLVERAKTGDYQAVRDLQSDMGTLGTDYKLSRMASERYKGRNLLKYRRAINNLTINHLEDTGHKDLASDLKKAIDLYRELKNTYYKNRTIGNLVNKNTRAEPASAKFLERSSVAVDKLKDLHPEINETLRLKGQREKLMKALKISKTAGHIAGVGIPSLAGLKYLFGKGKHESENYDFNSNSGEY